LRLALPGQWTLRPF